MKRSHLTLALLSLVIDFVAIFFGFYSAYFLRSGGEIYLYYWPIETYLSYVILISPVYLVLFASQGLYDPRGLPRGWKAIGKALIGLLSAWGLVLIGLYLWRSPEAQVLPRLLILYALGLTSALVVLGRTISSMLLSLIYRMGYGVTRTVVVSARNHNRFVKRLKTEGGKGRKLVATVDIAVFEEELEKIKDDFDEVIVESEGLPEDQILRILAWAENHYKQFGIIPTILSVRATNIEVAIIASTPVTYFLRTPLEGWRRIIKRLIDVLISGVILILFSPILITLSILIKLTSKGSSIYRQPRIGQDGRVFHIHKFRSMYQDANERFPDYRGWSGDERTDPRVTPIGRFLRKSNLDEMPQFWDIFIGKMSIVGPRPEQPSYVEKFSKDLPDYLKRHYVKSGLTGWAQVNGLRGDTSIEERVKYDLYYIENWSIGFDLRIMIVTILQIARQLIARN